MASVLGANPFPLCCSGEWFFSTLRYCPVFTHLCQCHWTSFLPPPLILHHLYTNLALCLLPYAPGRPVGVASFKGQKKAPTQWKQSGNCNSSVLPLSRGLNDVWATGEEPLLGPFRACRHQSLPSTPQLWSQRCCQLSWLHVLCRQWSLIRGKLRCKSRINSPRGLLWSEYLPALLQLAWLSRLSLLPHQGSKAGEEKLCVWFQGKALWKKKCKELAWGWGLASVREFVLGPCLHGVS